VASIIYVFVPWGVSVGEKLNIIVVISHDTGRHIGCYGASVETPNLNRIARNGIVFTNMFCTAP